MSPHTRRVNPLVPTGIPFPIADGREFRAMTTIEAAERLGRRAIAVLDDEQIPADVAREHALMLLAALVDITTSRTATEVKNQKDTDDISADAAKTVARTIEDLASDEHRALAETYSRLTGKYAH